MLTHFAAFFFLHILNEMNMRRKNAILLLKVPKAAGSVPPPSAPAVVISDVSFLFFTFRPPRVPVAVSEPCDHRVPGTFVAL